MGHTCRVHAECGRGPCSPSSGVCSFSPAPSPPPCSRTVRPQPRGESVVCRGRTWVPQDRQPRRCHLPPASTPASLWAHRGRRDPRITVIIIKISLGAGTLVSSAGPGGESRVLCPHGTQEVRASTAPAQSPQRQAAPGPAQSASLRAVVRPATSQLPPSAPYRASLALLASGCQGPSQMLSPPRSC